MSSVAFGANIAFIEELYEKYRTDPQSVSASWREFFAGYDSPVDDEEDPGVAQASGLPSAPPAAPAPEARTPEPAPAPPRPT
ncbi:MAG TPA: hypothetical protein VEU30_05010, partial [Thermoanaerobaculia bacterium]|nr:hypothetical protein [Thermoanaerobaculia bacterium]